MKTSELYEYFNGELPPHECERVLVWAAASEANSRQYERVKEEYFMARLATRAQMITCDRAAMRRRLGTGPRRRKRLRVAAAAAAVLLAAAGGLWVRFGVGESGEWDLASVERPANRAIIEFSDGRRQMVGEGLEQFVERNGTLLSVDDDGVAYRPVSEASEGQQEIFNKVIVLRGHDFFRVTLPDGSRVWLNSDSRLEYPVEFGGRRREVTLSGEGYFEVVADAERPFVVRTESQTATVLGTEFNISAYDGEPVATTLLSGSVRVEASGCEAVLEPGQQSLLEAGAIEVRAVNAERFAQWCRGVINIDDMSMAEILKIVARKYDVAFDGQGIEIEDIILCGSIPTSEKLSTVLAILTRVGDVKFKMKRDGEIKVFR